MKHLRLLPGLLLFGLTTGCATVLQGSHQTIRVETDPPGATATGANQTITTPGTLSFRRDAKDLDVVVEKEGYAPQRVTLTRKENGTQWANLALVPVGVGIGVGFGSLGSSEDDPLLIQVSDAVFGSKATWGFILGVVVPAAGFLVDHATGAAYKLDPPRLVLRLEPVSGESRIDDGPKAPRVPAELTRVDIIERPSDSDNGIRLPPGVLRALRPR
ncbi:MAG TPA: PEGA domain-containing protein [Thermoanaerobaculia bacterium]|nr:PEGA domain-containing protein [Thermoanaerobaculia bacterium]HQR67388.1 PEGA domain-containing protein [Thermoanaerobaculia bacterium]